MEPPETLSPEHAKLPPAGAPAPREGAQAAVRPPPANALNDSNPWPGLDYYTEETERYFHGRRDEAEELLSRVRRRRITVLYGQSGLGKSSVLQAGLFPLLRKDAWFPIYIRLRYRPESPNERTLEPLLSQSLKQISNAITAGVARGTLVIAPEEHPALSDQEPASDLASVLPRANETLREYLQRRQSRLRDQDGRPVALTLVFDQFEELFTLGRTALKITGRFEFIRELAYCVENEPAAATVTTSLGIDEERVVGGAEARLWSAHYRILISLREDFLAHLNDLGIQMPTLLENQMRLCHMDGWKALQAIATPGKGIIEPLVAREIVRYVAAQDRDDDAELKAHQETMEKGSATAAAAQEKVEEDYDHIKVDPAILSMACRELNVARISQGESKITRELVREMLQPGDTSLFRRFYDKSFPFSKPLGEEPDLDVPANEAHYVDDRLRFTEKEAAAIKRYIEDNLLEGKRRDFKTYDRAKSELLHAGVENPEGVFQYLVNRRLLRISPGRDSSSMVVELTHDVLCDPVNRSRNERLLHEAEERARIASELQSRSEIEERELQRKRETELRKRAERDLMLLRRQRYLGVTISVLAVVVACFAGAFYHSEEKQNAAEQELLKRNADRSNDFLKQAKQRLIHGREMSKSERYPVALQYLATAIRNDPRNLEATNLTWLLLGKRQWCWPVDSPLHCAGEDTSEGSLMLYGSFTPDGKHVAGITQNGNLWMTQNQDFTEFAKVKHAGVAGNADGSSTTGVVSRAPATAVFSNDGKHIIYFAHKEQPVGFWNWVERDGAGGHYEYASVAIPNFEAFRSAAWSPDGNVLVILPYRREPSPCRIFKREGNTYMELKLPTEFSDRNAVAVDFSPDGKKIATASSLGVVELWDTEFLKDGETQPEPKFLFSEPDSAIRISTVTFSPDGQTLVTSSYHSPPTLWDIPKGTRKSFQKISDADLRQVWRVAFSAGSGDVRICLTKLDSTVTICDMKTLAPIADPICLNRSVWYSSLSSDGRKVLTLSGTVPSALDTARVWNVANSRPLEDMEIRELQAKASPIWLPDMAEAVSGLRPEIDESDKPPATLPELRQSCSKLPEWPEYDAIWRHFFPEGDSLQ